MNPAVRTDHYGSLAIGLHWLMFAMLLAVYACIELRELYPRGSEPREALKAWHFSLGLGIFALVWLRLLARWIGGAPEHVAGSPAWERYLAGAAHVALYLFMIAMPVLGWATLSASGKAVEFFGAGLPTLFAADAALAKQIKEVHELLGSAGYVLIGLHAAAALYHHYVRKDATLRRMLP